MNILLDVESRVVWEKYRFYIDNKTEKYTHFIRILGVIATIYR